MVEKNSDPVAASTPEPSPKSSPQRSDHNDELDMSLVKEASSFSKVGLIVGGVVFALFVAFMLVSPSADAPVSTAEVEAIAPADVVADVAAEAVAVEAPEDFMQPAYIESVEFPDLANACNAADTYEAGYQCNELGTKYYNGIEVPKDVVRATMSFVLGCDKGSMEACSNVGMMYGGVSGIEMRPDYSFNLLNQACIAEVMHGCAELGVNYQNGVGVAQDKVRARELFEFACSRGWQEGCDYRNSLDQSGS